jgi:hypothetical protein
LRIGVRQTSGPVQDNESRCGTIKEQLSRNAGITDQHAQKDRELSGSLLLARAGDPQDGFVEYAGQERHVFNLFPAWLVSSLVLQRRDALSSA